MNFFFQGGEDVFGAADDVAGFAVRLCVRALCGEPVEALHPLHPPQGLRPLHCVSRLCYEIGHGLYH